jgi:hypothetical protein
MIGERVCGERSRPFFVARIAEGRINPFLSGLILYIMEWDHQGQDVGPSLRFNESTLHTNDE